MNYIMHASNIYVVASCAGPAHKLGGGLGGYELYARSTQCVAVNCEVACDIVFCVHPG